MREDTVLCERYRLRELAGRGGMADVYRAFDLRRQAYVAIKLLRDDLAEDPEFVRRFQREAHTLARLDHPNIVRFYSFEQQPPVAFIVMDYIPGMTLRRRLGDTGKPLSLAETSSILRQVVSALHYAHSLGYVHRDIKPGNIILKDDGTALLSDFGIARTSETMTMTGSVLGTPVYMSPEQITGGDITPSSDLYSLGIVLYELATGQRPFRGQAGQGVTTSERLADEHLHQPVPDACRENPDLPSACGEVIKRALAKEPRARWPDVISLWQAWQEAVGADAVDVTVTPATPARLSSAVFGSPTGEREMTPPLSQPMPAADAYTLPAGPRAGRGRGRNRILWMAGAGVIAVGALALIGMWLAHTPSAVVTPAADGRATEVAALAVASTATARSQAATAAMAATRAEGTVAAAAGASGATQVASQIEAWRRGTATAMAAQGTVLAAAATATAAPTPTPGESSAQREARVASQLPSRHNGETIFAYRATVPPTLDGDLNEWTGHFYVINNRVYGTCPTGLSGAVAVTWDNDRLYAAVRVNDRRHVQSARGRLLYLGDSLEMQFDARLADDFTTTTLNADDYQIGLSPGDFKSIGPEAYIWRPVESAGSAISVAARASGENYTLEAAIPWSVLGTSPRAELSYGFAMNVSNDDTPGTQRQECMLSISPRRTVYSNPTLWGTLILMDGQP